MTHLRKSLSYPALLIGLGVLLAGCAVGPDYEKPETKLPSQWTAEGSPQATDAKDTIQEAWWKNFNDPTLTQLIEKAAANNLDLKIAEARIAEARGQRAVASAALLPTGDAMGSATREANAIAIPGSFPGLTKPFNIFQTGFDASWELDLFGGHRRELESASAELEASEASRDDAIVSLLAEVARTYVDIRQYQMQLGITQNTIKSNEATATIARERFNAGDTPGIDVTQAEAQLEQAKTQLPYDQNMLAQAEYSMDVLLGEQPGATKAIITQPGPIPVSDKELVLAAPAAVIAQRPDIRIAERKLASATAQQGVAVAQFFPDISLSGFIGLLNTDGNSLFTAASKSWTAEAKVVWPILSYGTLSANLDTADAMQQEALATYQKSIISALSDVDRAVTAYTKQDQYRQTLAAVVAKNRSANATAFERYHEGLTSFIEVLDAERTLFASEIQLAQADAQTTSDLIAVYKSLGGGWNPDAKPNVTEK